MTGENGRRENLEFYRRAVFYWRSQYTGMVAYYILQIEKITFKIITDFINTIEPS
jgi:hypothetical protein